MKNPFSKYLEHRKEKARKKKWNAKLQLATLRLMVQEDNRWMASNEIVTELTERYLKVLSDNWESQPQESVDNFRDRLGLNPNHIKKIEPTYQEKLAIFNKVAKHLSKNDKNRSRFFYFFSLGKGWNP